MKRKKKWLLVVVPIIILYFLVYKTSLFTISTVKAELHGVSCVTSEQLEQESRLKGQLFFQADIQTQANKLSEKYVCIDRIEVRKQFPSTIVFQVEGRIPFIKVASFIPQPIALDVLESTPSSAAALINWSMPATPSGESLISDQKGVIFTLMDDPSLPYLFWPEDNLEVGKKLDPHVFDALAQIVPKLKELGNPVSVVKREEMYLVAWARERLAFRLGDQKVPLASLQLILQKAKIDGKTMNIIDLRFDKPVVVYSQKK